MMEAVRTSETSICFNKTAWRYILEGLSSLQKRDNWDSGRVGAKRSSWEEVGDAVFLE
jgi:hypothetical protein